MYTYISTHPLFLVLIPSEIQSEHRRIVGLTQAEFTVICTVPNLWSPSSEWKAISNCVLDVWRIDLDRVEDSDWLVLDADEIQRANRFVVPKKTQQFVRARAQIRRILSRYLEIQPDKIEFGYGEHGKPRLSKSSNVRINVSHSRQMGLLAIWGCGEVGIDIEYRAKYRDFDALANFAFSNLEKCEFQQLPAELRETVFYRTWTRKESYLKALGTGLHLSSRSFSVSIDPHCPAKLIECSFQKDEIAHWTLIDLPMNDHYVASMCYWGTSAGIRLWSEITY